MRVVQGVPLNDVERDILRMASGRMVDAPRSKDERTAIDNLRQRGLIRSADENGETFFHTTMAGDMLLKAVMGTP